MNRRLAITSLLLCLALLSFVAPASAQRKMRVPPLRSRMLVSGDWLADHMRDPSIVILYVGSKRAEYDAGHIPGARFVALDDIATTRKGLKYQLPPIAQLQRIFAQAGVDDDVRVILYGDWSGLSAARAYWTLDYLGHGDNAALLDGGLEEWRREERPVTTVVPQWKPARFTARVNPRVLVDIAAVRAMRGHSDVALIDARPANEYAGDVPDDILPRVGHIPGAANLFWQDLIDNKDDPQLKPAPEMRTRFAQAGAVPGKRVITYCRTGIQAAFDYFVAKFLGYDTALYDGSFQQWSAANEVPVATGK